MEMAPERPAGRLPWPEEWPSRIRLRSLALVLFLALLAMATPAFGVFGLVSGNYADGVFGLVSSPMMFAVAAVGFLTRRRGRRRGTESVYAGDVGELGQQAVVVPYSRALTAAALLVPLSTILFFGFLAFVTSVVISESGWGDLGQ